MTVAITKWGNSAGLRIPKEILRQLTVTVGDKMDIQVVDKTLIVKPSKPSLDELLAKVTEDNRHTEIFNDEKGNELI